LIALQEPGCIWLWLFEARGRNAGKWHQPPDQKPKPPVAKRVADRKFLKEKDERLGFFNRFVQPAATPILLS
jgi:hypothetical protein